MLPLGRYPVLRSGKSEEAFASIRGRHPGAYGFAARESGAGWNISVNVLDLGRSRLIATQSSAFSVSNMGDELVRVYLPLRQSGEIRAGERRQQLTPGVVTVAPVDDVSYDFDDGFSGLIASFPRDDVEETMRALSEEADFSAGLHAAFSRSAQLEPFKRQLLFMVRAIDEISDGIVHERRFRKAHEELLLIQLAQALATGDGARSQSVSSQHLARAMEFIRAHLSDEIGPTAIAKAAGCSLRNLQLLFRRSSGRTITETVRDMRLQNARERLSSGKGAISITEVALDNGFSHLSDFARHYRDTFGERPSETLAAARARQGVRRA